MKVYSNNQRDRGEKIKLLPFVNDIMLYKEHPKDYIKNKRK